MTRARWWWWSLFPVGCVAPPTDVSPLPARGPEAAVPALGNPADAEVPLPAAAGWQARLVHRGDAGVWYLHVAKVVPAYGQDEILAADDKGRLLVLSVYSGKWTATAVTPDGQWLAPTRPADVDPRVPGDEVYCGGKGGSVHRVTVRNLPFGKWALDTVEIGHVGGEEFHAMLAADVDPAAPGCELLAFGITGAAYQLQPSGDGDGFTMVRRCQLPGRVRDTVVLPAANGSAPWIVGASRSGDLVALRLGGGAPEVATWLHEDCGLGRIARGQPGPTERDVLYVTRDDGVLVRMARGADDRWSRAAIFAGPQGLRGVAAGRLFADGREAVAVYGYGREVHVVSRAAGAAWQAELIFAGAQQGHWLALGELDGRNGTDELVASGFGGDVVLLARPAGYGLPDAALAPATAAR